MNSPRGFELSLELLASSYIYNDTTDKYTKEDKEKALEGFEVALLEFRKLHNI